MTEVQYLEMPQNSQKSGKGAWLRGRRLPIAILVVVLVLAGLALGWLAMGRVSSLHALVDGNIFTVTPPVSGTLLEITVGEGEHVRAGQPVGRVDVGAYGRHVQQAGQEIASLRLPSMEEAAGRVRQAQEAERDMVTRLAQARHEEDVKKQVREEAVMAHVQAQLAMRGLQQPSGRSLGNRYAEAQRAEQAARQRLEQAKADFEQASRVRAAISGELQRVRDEIMLGKQLAARQRFAPYRDGTAGRQRQAPNLPVADGTLYAPVNGVVIKTKAASGQRVQSGEAVLLLSPDQSGEGSGLWAQAYYSLDYRNIVQPGQAASVRARNGGGSVNGVVAEVGMPQALPGSIGAGQVLPVRIELSGIPEGLTPGEIVDCVVKTHSLFGFSGI